MIASMFLFVWLSVLSLLLIWLIFEVRWLRGDITTELCRIVSAIDRVTYKK